MGFHASEIVKIVEKSLLHGLLHVTFEANRHIEQKTQEIFQEVNKLQRDPDRIHMWSSRRGHPRNETVPHGQITRLR